MSLDATPLTCKPRRKRCYDLDLDLWPVTLTTWSTMATHMLITCAKFHWNPSTTYVDIASCGISVNRRTPDARCESWSGFIPLPFSSCEYQQSTLIFIASLSIGWVKMGPRSQTQAARKGGCCGQYEEAAERKGIWPPLSNTFPGLRGAPAWSGA